MWSKKLRTRMYEKLYTNLFSALKNLKDVALDNFSSFLHNFIHALDLVRFTENLGLQPFFIFYFFCSFCFSTFSFDYHLFPPQAIPRCTEL